MIFKLFEDTLKMGFIVFCLYAVFCAFVGLRQPAWLTVLARRRLAILAALVLAGLALKITVDVVGGESGLIDRAVLVFVHADVSTAWTAFFEIITLNGSTFALNPVVSLTTIALLLWEGSLRASHARITWVTPTNDQIRRSLSSGQR